MVEARLSMLQGRMVLMCKEHPGALNIMTLAMMKVDINEFKSTLSLKFKSLYDY